MTLKIEGVVMSRINILDPQTSNKIAAGEVVERPFSVVKELVENSIDAGAANIIVEIEEGGRKSIRVTDDGSGIHAEDMKKAFLPHATSKISTIEDVYHVNTMGFRGEALASIASVSNTLLVSKTIESETGKEISITGGNIDYLKDAACNTGTSVTVKDLFLNVPARLKFLKSVQSESAAITDIINRLAIANPGISIKYFCNAKPSLTTYGTDNLLDTIRCIYGKSICDNIISFEHHSDMASVYGYIGNSEICRGSRNNQSIFVNKRFIKSKLITAAAENAFKSFITINKFPFFIIFLDIYPEFIDVNVHPTKSEVKFNNDREVFKLVFDSIHDALKEYTKRSFGISAGFENDTADKILYKEEPINQLVISEASKYNYADKEENTLPKLSIKLPIDLKSETKDYKNDQIVNNRSYEDKIPKLPEINVIGSVFSTYILAKGPEGLYIIDQHAAHEKVLFEKLKQDMIERHVVSQLLISPVVVELSHDDFACFIDNTTVFKTAGFSIDVFGANTVSIREVPLILGKPDTIALFTSILDNLKNLGSGRTLEIKYDALAKMACKSAVKAHNNLSNTEMQALIDDLRYLDEPFNCPHGRPTIIKMTLNDLEKKFKRIQ